MRSTWSTVFDFIYLPLRVLNAVLGILSGSSSWRLRTYEKRLFDAAAEGLDVTNRAILKRQFEHWFELQRFHKDRMNDIYFYFPQFAEKLDLPPDYRLARLRLKNGRRRVDVDVETWTVLRTSPNRFGFDSMVAAMHAGMGRDAGPAWIFRHR